MSTVSPDTPRWFLATDANYESAGPFTDSEIRRRYDDGELIAALLWTEGMPDWLPSEQVLPTITAPVAPPAPAAESIVAFEPPPQTEFSPYLSEASAALAAAPIEPPPREWSLKVAAMAIVTAGAVALTIWAVNKKTSWPVLHDIPTEESRALKNAAQQSLQSAGPSVAVAMSKNDPFAPNFYVAGNLGEGQAVEVTIRGIPETMIDGWAASAKTSLVLHDKIARTQAFRQANGNPFYRGDYSVTVSQQGHILTQKVFFIGGAKDQEYQQALAQYHDRLRAQAKLELQDLKQMSETLSHQLKELNDKILRIAGNRKLNLKARRTAWAKFSKDWLPLDAQLKKVFAPWTKSTYETELFYGDLYQLVKTEVERTSSIYQAYSRHLAGHGLAPLESRITNDIALGESGVQVIFGKIALLENLPVTSTGMPPRSQP